MCKRGERGERGAPPSCPRRGERARWTRRARRAYTPRRVRRARRARRAYTPRSPRLHTASTSRSEKSQPGPFSMMIKYLFPKLGMYVQFGGQTVPAFPCQTKREWYPVPVYPVRVALQYPGTATGTTFTPLEKMLVGVFSYNNQKVDRFSECSPA